MAHRTPKINDTVKFTDQQQAILNDAVEQLMEAGGLTALTQAHFNEAMKIVAQRFINAALQGELKHHLTQEDENLNEEESSAERVENKRNGYSKKTLHGNKGDLEIQVPRDRKGTYVPRLVLKHSRHFNDFDDAIIDLYGRGSVFVKILQKNWLGVFLSLKNLSRGFAPTLRYPRIFF